LHFVTLSAQFSKHPCDGDPGAQEVQQYLSSEILNPLLDMPIFILGDDSKHGTRAPVPGCRVEVQQHARRKI